MPMHRDLEKGEGVRLANWSGEISKDDEGEIGIVTRVIDKRSRKRPTRYSVRLETGRVLEKVRREDLEPLTP